MKNQSSIRLDKLVRRATGAREVKPGERIQSLWSGYGEIARVDLVGADAPSVIVKSVEPPTRARHPRGWSTNRSHERKLRSYAVEHRFYEHFSGRCGASCRVPRALVCHAEPGRWVFVLEDLDAAGFAGRRQELGDAEVQACLAWLAHFHATFLGVPPDGLWPVGTYWHLATRPDELSAMQDGDLRAAAAALDARLSACRHRSLVHGDAKVANFCFGAGEPAVAAVDFQYVGGGVGVKDVAYFFSSIWDSDECQARAADALDDYFCRLATALAELAPQADAAAVEAEWRSLYPLAWADFSRFLDGWAPGHYKLHPYARAMTREALDALARPR